MSTYKVEAYATVLVKYELDADDVHMAGASAINLLMIPERIKGLVRVYEETKLDVTSISVTDTFQGAAPQDKTYYKGTVEDCISKIRIRQKVK